MEVAAVGLPPPQITAINQAYWDALRAGSLVFQRCTCGHKWLPARTECPSCLGPNWEWIKASGRARLISWVVYYHAYHPSVTGRLPYTVAVVELDEGPRLVSNIVKQDEGEPLHMDMPLELRIQIEGDTSIPRFSVGSPKPSRNVS